MTPDSPSSEFLERIRARLGDRYDISRELLGGGMSRVFVAREIALDRQIVIKFLPSDIAAEANRHRFRREIQMAARLSHPHIAPLLSAAEEGELLYYTMPYIPGESLKHSLESGHRFGIGETLEILRDVAAALAYAHRAGIVHRDIKPANILREGEHAVVTDFGVAKAVSQALGLDMRTSVATLSGMAIGTPAYMAPEQLAGDASADHRVDIYAFGLLGYELLSGHSPFRAPSPQALMAAQLTQPPPPLLDARADVPPVLAALLTRCLEKDATQRPASAEAVLEVLRAVSTTSGVMHLAPAQSKSSPSKAVLAVGGVLAAAALAFVLFARMPSPPVPPAVKDAAKPTLPVAPPAPDPSTFSRVERDSLRLLSEQIARKEQRLLGLLKDSISNAVHRTVADSIAQAKQLELATARVQDSLMRVSRIGIGSSRGRPIPPAIAFSRGTMKEMEALTGMVNDSMIFRMGPNTFNTGVFAPMSGKDPQLSPEAFAARAANLGPQRRIGISVYSGLRSGPVLDAAGILRDSILTKLRTTSRFVIIPGDSISAALARSRSTDSLRTWLDADLWATINAPGSVAADSLAWSVTLRDFTAHGAYSYRTVMSKRFAPTNAADPAIISALAKNIAQLLDAMDKAPRRHP